MCGFCKNRSQGKLQLWTPQRLSQSLTRLKGGECRRLGCLTVTCTSHIQYLSPCKPTCYIDFCLAQGRGVLAWFLACKAWSCG